MQGAGVTVYGAGLRDKNLGVATGKSGCCLQVGRLNNS